MNARIPGRWPYSSTPAAYIRVATIATTTIAATSSPIDSATCHGWTAPTISRASITNGLNGGRNDAIAIHVPPPPPSATIADR